MPTTIYNSRPFVERMTEKLQAEALRFQQHHGRMAQLAQVIVGNDDAAQVYRRQLINSCHAVGLRCTTLDLPFETTEAQLRTQVATLSEDIHVDGVVLLLPLPSHIRQRVVTDVLASEKDVDGLGSRNAGNLLLGFPSFVPSTADVVLAVLEDAGIPIAGKHAVIVGRSNVGGKPTMLVLMRHDATVTICHSQTQDLAAIVRTADILVVSVGRPATITTDMIRPGVVILDAGINTVNGRIVGDVEENVQSVASFVTPVPGGLGPLTHLTLIRHTLQGPQ